MSKRQKRCKCKVPGHPQNIPGGDIHKWHGMGRCSKCEGVIRYPIPRDEYQGDDPVQGWLFTAKRDNTEYDFETVVAELLVRMDQKLTTLVELASSSNALKEQE